jgi:hypothetical protein
MAESKPVYDRHDPDHWAVTITAPNGLRYTRKVDKLSMEMALNPATILLNPPLYDEVRKMFARRHELNPHAPPRDAIRPQLFGEKYSG